MCRKNLIIRNVCAVLAGIIGGGIAGSLYNRRKMKKEMDVVYKKYDKFFGYFKIFDRWFSLRTNGNTLETYFVDRGYHDIAIYGMGIMGNHFYEEACAYHNVTVAYAIDRKGDILYSDLAIYHVEDELPTVDAIIVTATFDFMEIAEALKDKVNCPIISLGEVVFEV